MGGLTEQCISNVRDNQEFRAEISSIAIVAMTSYLENLIWLMFDENNLREKYEKIVSSLIKFQWMDTVRVIRSMAAKANQLDNENG